MYMHEINQRTKQHENGFDVTTVVSQLAQIVEPRCLREAERGSCKAVHPHGHAVNAKSFRAAVVAKHPCRKNVVNLLSEPRVQSILVLLAKRKR
jgi:hypothetical protein